MTIATEHDGATEAPRLGPMPPVPDKGGIVTVRGASWAVVDVREQGLPHRPADPGEAGVTHVVDLQSLEEDRFGEELSVVWELEVGQTVAPQQGLPETIGPDSFDDPDILAAFVDAVRWGAVTSADENAYQAPFRSGANVEAYQLEPLRRALRSARTNLLLADDVGLGKTIEAGLVAQELLLRQRARSILIVCPPSLGLKWQDEMRDKFGLDFEIVNSELLAQVRRSHGLNANPFRIFPRIIVSMAWLPSVRAQRLLRDVYTDVADPTSVRRYAFDLLIVDEAHHVAPASPTAVTGFRGYAVDSDRTRATRTLAERCEHRLFLSATPHNGYSESFTALMEMIDGRRFKRGAILDESALREIAVRRLKADLAEEKGFKSRELKSIIFSPDSDEVRQFNLLDGIITASARATGRSGGASLGIVGMLLKKRFLSSPWSFALTLGEYLNAEGGSRLEITDQDQYYQEVLGSGQSDEEEGAAEHPEFTALRRSKSGDPLSAATGHEITALADWGEQYQERPDSRLEALIEFLDATCRPYGTWSNERVVVFTEYAATLDWIARILTQRGYREGHELATIQGSTLAEDRELIRARFTAPPDKHPVRVLVATDSAGEGIDLQDHCHRLVNFDIPFNPSRLEQRIGRIDRYGQQRNPEIYQFDPAPTTTKYAQAVDFLLGIVRRKIGTIAGDLGSVNEVIDADIRDYFTSSTSGGRRARLALRDDGNAVISKALAGGQALSRTLTDLQRTYTDRKVELHLTPENARRVVDTALEVTRQPPLRDVGDTRTDAAVFEIPALGPAWQSALRGLDTRVDPGVLRHVTFDDKATLDENGGRRDDLVHIHLGHTLLQRSARVLRSALFGLDSPVHRVTAVALDGLPQSCVAVVSRLALVGRGGLRLHEEVFLTGVRLRGGAMAEEKVELVLEDALDSRHLALAASEVRHVLAGLWNADGSALRARLLSAMTTRSAARQERQLGALYKRRDTDIDRAAKIYSAFRVNLRESYERLARQIREEDETLFPDEQQRQRRRDLASMDERLLSVDDEEQREIASIRARYEDVKPYITAVAVVFALTPQDTANPGRIQA